jgi:hypothetical protein
LTDSNKSKFVGAGGIWSREEETLLYEATVGGMTTADIAERHGRTVGGIKARQRRMQLRDRVTGELFDPLPSLQHHAKPERQSMSDDLARKAAPPTTKKKLVRRVEDPTSTFEFDPNYDPITLLWTAVQHDIQHLVSARSSEDAMRLRNQEIVLKRLDPGADYKSVVSLEVLGQAYGITRERVRQVQVKGEKILAQRSTTKPRACQQVIAKLVERNVQDDCDSAAKWTMQLLLEEGVARDFGRLILRAMSTVLGLPPVKRDMLIDGYAAALGKLPRARDRYERRHSVVADQNLRTSNADAFVLTVLKKAKFGGDTAASQIPVSADLPALRSCHGDREVFSSCLQQMVPFESSGERRLIRALDQCTIVDEFAAQALEIPYYDPEYGDRSYYPDLLLKTTEGLVFVVEIKARPLLADRQVQIKANAAETYLGARGVGYCLVDRDGEGCGEVRNIAVSDSMKTAIRDKLRESGVFRFNDLKAYLGHWPDDGALDQVQSLAFAHGLDYRAQLYPSQTQKMGLGLNFILRLKPPSKSEIGDLYGAS